MNILFAVLSGIIQGLAEFLPISSSGHLALFENVFGTNKVPMNFDILLHIGTLLAVFVVYYKDIFALIPAFFSLLGKVFRGNFKMKTYNENERLCVFFIIACIPMIPAAFLDNAVEALGTYTWAVGALLIVNAIILFVSDKMAKGTVTEANARPKNALIVGLCQLFAVIPGISRSGSTITGGLTQKFTREFAVKFSFILSIPAIIGAFILNVKDMTSIPSSDVLPYVLGTVAAFVCGVAAMKLLIFISRKATFRPFSYYCAIIGVTAVILGIFDIKIPIKF